MKAISEEYTRLNEIAHSNIPVSEDSPIYNFFAQRREEKKKLINSELTEEEKFYTLSFLSYLENNIKNYLWL